MNDKSIALSKCNMFRKLKIVRELLYKFLLMEIACYY